MEITINGMCGCCSTMGKNATLKIREWTNGVELDIQSHTTKITLSKEELKKILSILE